MIKFCKNGSIGVKLGEYKGKIEVEFGKIGLKEG